MVCYCICKIFLKSVRMALRNFPGYVFHEFSREPYLKFIRKAQSRSDDNRNMEDLKLVTQLLPPEFTMFPEELAKEEKPEEKAFTQNEHVTDQKHVTCTSPKKEEPPKSESPVDMTTDADTEDLCALIIENLERELPLDAEIFNDLKNLSKEQATGIFEKLLEQGIKNNIVFGESFLKMGYSDDVVLVQCYVEKLLICKANEVYNTSFEKVFNNCLDQYPNIIKRAFLKKIISPEEEDLEILCQYIASVTMDHRTNFLRAILHSIQVETLYEKHFPVLEVLLNKQTDVNLLEKLVEIMCNHAEKFSSDKGFGKLLNTVIQQLGSNVTQLEQPLKYILGCHKSIWRVKAKKAFDSRFSYSLFLTQSVRF